MLSKPEFLFSSSYGTMLLIKMFLVAALLGSFAIHVRIIRKEVEQQIIEKRLSDAQIAKLRKKIIIVGEVTVVISVLILLFAAILDTGI